MDDFLSLLQTFAFGRRSCAVVVQNVHIKWFSEYLRDNFQDGNVNILQNEPQQSTGRPYPPHNSSLGGVPDIIPDVPITAVFLFLYIAFSAAHMKIFRKNNARGHKFIFSGAIFGKIQASSLTR